MPFLLSRRCLRRFLAWFLALGTLGCLNPEQALQSADGEVYALIDARRAELFGDPNGFRIDAPPNSLRQRILDGSWQGEQVWTLLDCLEIAAENNRGFQSQREALYQDALNVTLERWQFSSIRAFGGGGGLLGTGDEADSAEIDAGGSLSRLLGNGARVVGGIGASLFRLVRNGDGWDLASNLSLAVTQPLLMGSGTRVTREPLTQAERNLLYQVRSYERFRRTFGVQVADAVYDLLQAIVVLGNEQRNYANLVKLRERTQALAEAGQLSPIEADQASQDELRSENRLLALEANVQRQRDEFLLFLGLPINTPFELDPNEFDRLEGNDPNLNVLTSEMVERLAVEHRLDVQTARDQAIDAERQVLVAADALRAGLDVDVQVGANSRDGQPLSFEKDDLSWSAALSLDLPIDRIPARNAYRNTLIQEAAAQRNRAQVEDLTRVNVRDALRNTFNTRDSYIIQKGAVLLAERRIEGANLSLEAGRASTRDVLEAQDALLEAENAATGALIDFTLARLQLYLEIEALRLDETGLRIEREALQGIDL